MTKRKSEGLSYENWLVEVDKCVQAIVNFPLFCLNWNAPTAYDLDLTPEDAARRAIASDEILLSQSKEDGISLAEWLTQFNEWEHSLSDGEGFDRFAVGWSSAAAYDRGLTSGDAAAELMLKANAQKTIS